MSSEFTRLKVDRKRKRLIKDKEKRLAPNTEPSSRPIEEYRRVTPRELMNLLEKEDTFDAGE